MDQGSKNASRDWWGGFDLPVARAARFKIGPLDLRVEHLEREWRIMHRIGADPLDAVVEIDLNAAPRDPLPDETVDRFGHSDGSSTLNVQPLSADRSVVSKPERSFHVPESESIAIYVSSPLWIGLSSGTRPGRSLSELPVFRPSDTWFGSTTDGGELCYASRTACRLDPEHLPIRPHRAVTKVSIENRGSTPLHLDRIHLPVTSLSLYRTSTGMIWTQDVELVRDSSDEYTHLLPVLGTPSVDPKSKLISKPRDAEPSSVFHVFTRFLG